MRAHRAPSITARRDRIFFSGRTRLGILPPGRSHNGVSTFRRPAHILLVEDNPDDVELTSEAFRDSGLRHVLHVVEDGVAALAFLRREGVYAERPVPDLVLLDLNLPKQSGHEVLATITADPVLTRIPVIVLTSSAVESDMRRCAALRAHGYVIKPADLDGFVEVVQTVDRFWQGLGSPA